MDGTQKCQLQKRVYGYGKGRTTKCPQQTHPQIKRSTITSRPISVGTYLLNFEPPYTERYVRWCERSEKLFNFSSYSIYLDTGMFAPRIYVLETGAHETFPVPQYTFTRPSPPATDPINVFLERSTVKDRETRDL